MRAGKLRHRITIQTPTTTNTSGVPTTTWSTFATRWASVEPFDGREFQRADQTQAQLTHTVRLRWLAGVTSQMRVVHDGRYLNIERVIDKDERHIELELVCSEKL